MAKVVQTTLQIHESNVEQYCIADGLSLNTGGYAIRLYLNGHTQGSAILNDAAKEVLYPSATAHPFKIDSTIRANKSGGKMTISLQFNGTSVQSETGDWGTGLKNKTKEGISDPVVINSNRSTEIKWHIKGSSTISRFSIASTKLTFYFNQYEMRPLVGDNANGIQKVTVSNASPYQGDTVTFTPKLVNGATWVGWYSDAACTNLVSTEQNYSVSPSSDITLYAKATIDATLYNVSAVAGSEVTSVSVSDSIVPNGSTATFTAQVNENCSFEAWYSDNTYTTVVSTENPYTATITADTTLYAKAHKNSFNISVGSAEHGTATVSANTVHYGDSVTFTFTPEDETWELYGWYSDSGFTQLVSEANPYTFTATENVTLYPKVGKKRYEIKIKCANNIIDVSYATVLRIASADTEKFTLKDWENFRSGEYLNINSEAMWCYSEKNIDRYGSGEVSIFAPLDSSVSMYSYHTDFDQNANISCFTENGSVVSNGNVYIFTVSSSRTFGVDLCAKCICSAISSDGVGYSYAFPEKACQERYAEFVAEPSSGYAFLGWYSDESCTQLVSSDNPAQVLTPSSGASGLTTTLTLYAKAIKATYTIRVGTADHCTTSVSAATAQYGDTVTFNCMVDEGYEFKGWYSDEGITQLVSESAEYVHSVTGDVTLWPKVEIIIYTVSLTWPIPLNFPRKIISYSPNSLTANEQKYLKTGELDKIDPAKIYDSDFVDAGFVVSNKTISVSCPATYSVSIYIKCNDAFVVYIKQNNVALTNWPYLTITPTQNETYQAARKGGRCNCNAIAGNGIEDVDVTTPVVQGTNAQFTAFIKAGYKFNGWYSDSEYQQLISINNPASIITPINPNTSGNDFSDYPLENSYTLYAKAESITTSTTGIYFKCNGSWIKAKSVFKKTNGAWVEQEDLSAIFSGESSGTASNYVYGGSV